MGRRYDTAHYLSSVEEIRRRFPQAAITTDLMVGFPGETEGDFLESVAFARKVGFAKIHVFPYSPRPGTVAAGMAGQLPPEEKRRRAAELIAAGEVLRREFLEGMAGTTQEVLFEEGGPGGQEGYTANYTPVVVPEIQDLRGRMERVVIDGLAPGEGQLLGHLAE